MYYHQCYSDIPALFGGRGIAQGGFPYLTQGAWEQVEYPVLTGLAMWFTGVLTRWLVPTGDATLTYFDVNVVFLVGWLAVTVWATARTAGRRPYDAAMVALAPGVILAGTINWDLWAVGLTALAMLAWARSRPVLAGLLLGLGTAAKFYPLLLLGPLLVLCWRAGRTREWWRATLAAAGAWLVVNLPFMLANFDGWATFYRLSDSRTEGFSSIWFVLANSGHAVPPDLLNRVASGLLAVACVAIAVGGADGAAPAPGGGARVPGAGRVRADQQGLLPAVRRLAGPAGRAGPPPVARLPDLAGHRGRALRRHLAVPGRLHQPRPGAAVAGLRRHGGRPHRSGRCGCAR